MLTFSAARLSTLSITLAVAMTAGVQSSQADIFARPPAAPERLDAHVAWQIQLPSAQTASFKAFYLLEGRIYAVGTDGVVVAVKADTGEVAWIRPLAGEGDALWPPVTYHTQEKDAVVFARLNDVVLLDLKTGVPIDFLKLTKPTVCGITVAPGRVFVPQANGRLAAYRLRDGYIFWRAAFNEQFTVPPAYAPATNAVVAVDDLGLVSGLKNEHHADKRVLFRQNLRSAPTGPVAADGVMLYLTTANQTLHAIDMGRDQDSDAGDVVWQYRLAGPPAGGPIVTETAIYQAIQGGGLHRIAKNQGESKNWFDPQGEQFMAEWPDGVVVLRTDGTLALINNDPAHPLALGSAAGFAGGLSNTVNDAIFLTTPSGKLRCIRPTEAAPLQLASFLPAPTTLPAEPDEPTDLDRIRESARKKADKRAGRAPAVEIVVKPSPDEAKAQTQPAVAAPAGPAEPYDPLRSKRPVVR